jgi:Fe-S-cluster-containing hydrogenase component 2
MMNVRRKAERCYSCGQCRLVCSYHHTGRFWPEKSSILVYRKPREGKIVWKRDATCDRCMGETVPLCVKYCKYDALVLEKTPSEREGTE